MLPEQGRGHAGTGTIIADRRLERGHRLRRIATPSGDGAKCPGRASLFTHSYNGRNQMKKNLWIPLVLALAAFTAGCNTMEGMGEDIERGGQKIQKEAR